MKCLIDECLSRRLAVIAEEAGLHGSAHVVHRGMAGKKDWELMDTILNEDWTFVTRNSDDFRPRQGSSSKAPCYVGVALHAGLICLNPPAGATGATHEVYFKAALSALGPKPDLVNKVVEVWPDGDGSVRVEIYDLPEED